MNPTELEHAQFLAELVTSTKSYRFVNGLPIATSEEPLADETPAEFDAGTRDTPPLPDNFNNDTLLRAIENGHRQQRALEDDE